MKDNIVVRIKKRRKDCELYTENLIRFTLGAALFLIII